MTDNVVDLNKFRQTKQKVEEDPDKDKDEYLHNICTYQCNDAIDSLQDWGLDTTNIEFSPEMIFFFEAFKGLIMKCAGHWHPFQDLAQEFFDAYGIKVVEDENGNYRFTLEPEEDEEPANDA